MPGHTKTPVSQETGACQAKKLRRKRPAAERPSRLFRERRAAAFRLRQAAALLAQTELSIEQVAAEVGYADPSAFYRQFAAAFGMTPGEYRRLYAE